MEAHGVFIVQRKKWGRMGVTSARASHSERVQRVIACINKDRHNHESQITFTHYSSHQALNGKSNLCSLIPLSKQTKYKKTGISVTSKVEEEA